jgi:hypothetical protein
VPLRQAAPACHTQHPSPLPRPCLTTVQVSGTDVPLQLDLLNLEEAQLLLSFKTDPSAKRPRFASHVLVSVGMEFISDIEALPIKLPGLELEHAKVGGTSAGLPGRPRAQHALQAHTVQGAVAHGAVAAALSIQSVC